MAARSTQPHIAGPSRPGPPVPAYPRRVPIPDRRPDPPPLRTRDVPTVAAGTAGWAVLLVVALVQQDRLREQGRLWWVAAAACGLGLGLLGVAFLVRRQRRVQRRSAPDTPGGERLDGRLPGERGDAGRV